jgi:nicotinamide riboside kinase
MRAGKVRIALLGAESTGKSQLAHDLKNALLAASGQGVCIAVVDEVLRQWCEAQGRTPRADEQLAIAQEQERRVQQAWLAHDVVIADTTALMTAIYSDHVFGDTSLYAYAHAQQTQYDHHLLMGLDVAWQSDGIQRDSPQVRPRIDAMLRQQLQTLQLPYQTVYGLGLARVQSALACLNARGATKAGGASANWQWVCERCSDGDCEHRLFTRLTANDQAQAQGAGQA